LISHIEHHFIGAFLFNGTNHLRKNIFNYFYVPNAAPKQNIEKIKTKHKNNGTKYLLKNIFNHFYVPNAAPKQNIGKSVAKHKNKSQKIKSTTSMQTN
jgi:hypothetical protein